MTYASELADDLERWAKSAHTSDLHAGSTSLSETLAKAAAMLRAGKVGVVNVKPLEWEKQDGPTDYYVAETVFGKYGTGIDFNGKAYDHNHGRETRVSRGA